MEDDHVLDTGLSDGFVITEASRRFLSETAKWAKFLAIAGFVFIGIFVIFGLFFGAIMGSAMHGLEDAGQFGGLGAGTFGLIYVGLALLYFFPTLYLYRFATRTKAALVASDSEALSRGLEQLKSTFKFMGVLMAVIIGFYVLLFLGGLLFGIAGGL